jgi:hypothetical protein
MPALYLPSTPADVGVVAASDSAAGIVELATAAEVLTGTDSDRAPSVAALAGFGQARREVRATGAIAETVPRWAITTAAIAMGTSGRLYMMAIQLPTCVVTSISWLSGATALTTGTSPHLWVALYDASRNLLAQSADDTAPVWAANSVLTKSLTTPQSVAAGAYYLGICRVQGGGGTANTFAGAANRDNNSTITPILFGSADNSLTGTAPNPAAALTQVGGTLYAYVS